MAETITHTATKRIAVVTGANRGIGFEICRQLASNGVIVILTARDEKRGNEALEKLKKGSGFGDDHVFFHRVDVMDSNSINSLADFVKTQFGKLDILVNNAGIGGLDVKNDAFSAANLGDKPEEVQGDWSKTMRQTYKSAVECLQTNYYGPKKMTEALTPLLQLSDSPRVVTVSSTMGKLEVNNAGVGGVSFNNAALEAADLGDNPREADVDWSKIASETYESAVECLQINYYGPKRMIEALTPLLLLSDSPRVVTISSSMGKLKAISSEWAKGVLSDWENLTEEKVEEVLNQFLSDFKEGLLKTKGWPVRLSAYSVSKAALNAYTRIAAKINPDICINCVCPGFVKTDIMFNKGVFTVEEGALSPVRLAVLPHGGPSGLFFFRDQVSSFE